MSFHRYQKNELGLSIVSVRWAKQGGTAEEDACDFRPFGCFTSFFCFWDNVSVRDLHGGETQNHRKGSRGAVALR